MNKTLKVMTSAALLAGVVAPVAVTTVSANSDNIVSKVLYVDDDYKTDGTAAENYITIKEDDVAFTSGDTFRLTLPSGVKWLKNEYNKSSFSIPDAKVVSATDGSLEIELGSAFGEDSDNSADVGDGSTSAKEIKVPLLFEVDGAEGEIKVNVEPRGTTLTAGSYTIAVVGEGNTTASIASVKTIGDGGEIDTLRIDETSIRAIYAEKYDKKSTKYTGPQEITLKLPSDFEWDLSDAEISLGGGFTNTVKLETGYPKLNDDKDEIIIQFTFDGQPKTLGTFYVEGLAIDADKDADYGEVEVDLDGDEVSGGSLVVAEYGDYGTDAELEGDVPTLLAGRLTDDSEDVETVEVTIKENIEGSWLAGRSVDIELPTWVKVLGVDIEDAKNISYKSDATVKKALEDVINEEIDGDSNEVNFDLPAGLEEDGKKEFKIKFYISTKADAEGDVTVKVGGRAGVELAETVIAKVVSPVTVETEKVDVRTGIKKQALNDIVITEAVKGALLEDKTVQLKLSDGEFTDVEPEITVKEGNIKIDEDSIDIDEDGILTFDIDGESTKASKIVISGLSLDLSRSIPEGDVTVEVGGDAIVQNQDFEEDFALAIAAGKSDADVTFGDKTYEYTNKDDIDYDLNGDVDAGEFDRDYVAKLAVATVVTPADGNATAEEVKLVIGSDKMMVGDKEVTLDAAPFVEASTGRTYLPLRAIAEALGANSVDWSNNTATVVKGGLVAQMTIGANQYVLNGAKIGMDGKAQIVNGRTVLPIRALGSALGADVQWDEATKTVTIK